MIDQTELDRIKRIHFACSHAKPVCPHSELIAMAQELLDSKKGRGFNMVAAQAFDWKREADMERQDGKHEDADRLEAQARELWDELWSNQ